MKACRFGFIDIIHDIMKKDPLSIHIKDSYGRCALHVAVQNNANKQILKLLIDSGFRVNTKVW
jgi:hypothetical protein